MEHSGAVSSFARLKEQQKQHQQNFTIYPPFLGALAKLSKAIISFVLSVRLPAWNSSAPTGRIFMKFDLSIFLNPF